MVSLCIVSSRNFDYLVLGSADHHIFRPLMQDITLVQVQVPFRVWAVSNGWNRRTGLSGLGKVMDATISELQQGQHVEIEPSTVGPPFESYLSDPGLARSHPEGHVLGILAPTLPSHKISQSRHGPYYETSPYGREYNV